MKTEEIISYAQKLSTATIFEASQQTGALSSFIKPISPKMKLVGRAFPVKSPPADNLWLHRAVYSANKGDVIVADVAGYEEAGHWGDILAQAAQLRGIAGLVINGGVRDTLQMIEMNFPVFSKGICIRGTSKNRQGKGSIGKKIIIHDVEINEGDLVVGDADGVVIVPKEFEKEIIQKALEREAKEAEIVRKLLQGETTLKLLNLE